MRHKRIVVSQYGGPEVITAIEEDIPAAMAGEVRIRVLAAGQPAGRPVREGLALDPNHTTYRERYENLAAEPQK